MEIKRLIYVGELDRTPFAPDHMGIRQGLSELGVDDFRIVDPILLPRDEIIRQCNEFDADVVIHGNTDSLALVLIPDIKAKKQVFFMGDYRPNLWLYKQDGWDTWLHNAKGLDLLAISNKNQIPMWESEFGIKTVFWPHGCYVPDELQFDKDFEHDVVFVGTMNNSHPYGERVKLIEEIDKLLGHKITFINGSGVDGRNEVWRTMPKLYHSAKVVLDISHFWDAEGYASGRYWYSAGLGACSVTKRFPGCEEFYTDKVHKAYFDTPEEAAELIEFYIAHPEERRVMKLAAANHNKETHNYTRRFKELLSLL